MKAKQIKKLLSITLASAMVVSGGPGIPTIVMAEEETQSEAKNGQTSEGEDTDTEKTSEIKTTAETEAIAKTETAAVPASETVAEEKNTEFESKDDKDESESEKAAGSVANVADNSNSETPAETVQEENTAAGEAASQEEKTEETSPEEVEKTDAVQEEPQSPVLIEETPIEGETDTPKESGAEAEPSKTVTVTWTDKNVTCSFRRLRRRIPYCIH